MNLGIEWMSVSCAKRGSSYQVEVATPEPEEIENIQNRNCRSPVLRMNRSNKVLTTKLNLSLTKSFPRNNPKANKAIMTNSKNHCTAVAFVWVFDSVIVEVVDLPAYLR